METKENAKQRKAREKKEKQDKQVKKSGGMQASTSTTEQATVEKTAKPGALPPLPALPREKRARKPKPTKPCLCGCKTPTTGDWAPGHDARANGWAIRIERELIAIKDVPENEREGAKYMLKLRKEQGVQGGHVRLVKKAKATAGAETDTTEAAGEAVNE